MRTHLNTLFVTRENVYLRKDGAAVEVRQEGQTLLRVPLHNLDGIICMNWDASASSQLMAGCAEAGVTLSFCNPYGRFLAATRGFAHGNVMLRREQYRQADHSEDCLRIAGPMIAAKLANSRVILRRAIRDYGQNARIDQICRYLANEAESAASISSLDTLRGTEGEAASRYFSAFPELIRSPGFEMNGRSRRPPLDRVNALLSFCYSLLAHDCRSASESVGLDPAVGFLHRDRPGRPSLALDLMEELRPVLADRCVLTLINTRQISPSDFVTRESGAVELKEDSRKTVLTAWQERKQDEFVHPVLNEKVTYGLLPFIQARLLAKTIRADFDVYPAFLYK